MEHLDSITRHLRSLNVTASTAAFFDAEDRPHGSGIAAGNALYFLDIPESDRDHRPVEIHHWDRSLGWVRVTDTHRHGHWRVRIAHAIKADLETRSALKPETKRMTTTTYFGESRRSAWA